MIVWSQQITKILAMVYVLAICAANFSVQIFGPVVTPLNAFLLIGLDFVIRDKLHEWFGFLPMLGLVVVAGVVSYSVNPATDMIAIASVSAFALASVTDATVYQALIRRSWLVKSNGSNLASSIVDSIVFPMVAFGAFLPWVVLGQFAAKVLGGSVWAWLLRGVK